MSTEQIPTTWSDADEAFFRIVARVFPSESAVGASVLLAGFDDVEPRFEAGADRGRDGGSGPAGVPAMSRPRIARRVS